MTGLALVKPRSVVTRDEFRTPITSLFDQMWTEMFREFDPFKEVADRGRKRAYPKVDVRKNGEDLVIEAVVPFVKKEDLDVSIRDGTLYISGHVQEDKKIEEGSALITELVRSSFTRSFPLNDQMYDAWDKNGGEVKADLKDGLLTVTLVGYVNELEARPEVRQIDIG